MKKVSILLTVIFTVLSITSFSQTTNPTSTDFFVAKWEILVKGTPTGDVIMKANIIRKDGKLGGELTRVSDSGDTKMPFTKIEEEANKIKLYFEAQQVGEISMELVKVDNDNLKGTIYESYEATAKRVK